MKLYPNYKPIGIRKDWEHSSMGVEGAGDVLRRHGVSKDFGNPIEAVAWFDMDEALRVLVADYANGRRVTLNKSRDGYRLSTVTPSTTGDGE